ncbi:hypothetical protein Glove_519g95 [Diversispora epigaea]|uniref:Uncharacterized protein n=1 Tax=Diversispora epigaea TaxID=1348612 RepID=A0A397GGJ3_9GLOM|nr:hypothetical protein Glove_519g95 [Diversispora epigaea]
MSEIFTWYSDSTKLFPEIALRDSFTIFDGDIGNIVDIGETCNIGEIGEIGETDKLYIGETVAPNFICHQLPIIIGETSDIGNIVDIGETCNIGEIGEIGETDKLYIGETGENSNKSSCVFYERNIRETFIPFFDNENNLIQQDLDNIKENNTTKEKKRKYSRGKRKDEI